MIGWAVVGGFFSLSWVSRTHAVEKSKIEKRLVRGKQRDRVRQISYRLQQLSLHISFR